MPFAFAGKLLHVNLTTGEIAPKPLDEEKVLKYLGARGFNARLSLGAGAAGCGSAGTGKPAAAIFKVALPTAAIPLI